jgi:DNA replication protein DnaC
MQANLPTRYDCYWWDTFPAKSQEQTNMIKHLQWYTENWRAKKLKHNFLTLWGGVGTGKTCMAVIIAKCLISYYAVKTRFISGQQLVDEMMQGIRDFKLSAKDVQGYYYHLPLLIVDDFWAENSSPAVKNRLFDLLNFRYHRQSCTILTTNVVLPESNDAQLIRLWDRIKEQPNKQIKFSWNSLRSSG